MELTKEQKHIYYINRKAAAEYYNLPKGWILHHKDITMKENDVDRYIQWRPEDLVPMTRSQHRSLHNHYQDVSGTKNPRYGVHLSDETKNKISESLKKNGNLKGDKNPFFGKHHSEETKKKISMSKLNQKLQLTGTKWYNNGEKQIQAKECPEGWVAGMLKR